MLKLPFLTELEQSEKILVAGMGGGFDVFCGLPLYFGLQALGKQVHLANLSFSFLPPLDERLSPAMLAVTADTPRFGDYFPEQLLAEWFRGQGQEVTIYCFERTGVQPLLAAYQTLMNHLQLDTIVLVDGGTDSLMRGDEPGLGTPHEDIASLTAVHQLQLPRKLMACLGFGVDSFHGINHYYFLEGVAELTQAGGYLGAFSLLNDMPEVQQYRQAAEAVFATMPNAVSIVTSSILSALAGHYGDHHATPRTHGSELWINPLMPLYWCFQVDAVAERVMYLQAMEPTVDYMDVRQVIGYFRSQSKTIRPPKRMPG
jgi:hypothetical protein